MQKRASNNLSIQFPSELKRDMGLKLEGVIVSLPGSGGNKAAEAAVSKRLAIWESKQNLKCLLIFI